MCDRVRTPNYALLILDVWMCGRVRTPSYSLLMDVWMCGRVGTPNYALIILDVCVIVIAIHPVKYPLVL